MTSLASPPSSAGGATVRSRFPSDERTLPFLPPVAGLPLFGYLAIALLLIGTLMLMPRIAAVVLAVIPSPRDAASRLALLQLRGAPGQAAVSLAAIVASMSLMISMAIMVTSSTVTGFALANPIVKKLMAMR